MPRPVRLVQVAGISSLLIPQGMNHDRKVRFYPITDGEMGLPQEEDPMTFKLQVLNGLIEVQNPEAWAEVQMTLWGFVRDDLIPQKAIPTEHSDPCVRIALEIARNERMGTQPEYQLEE